MTWRNKSAPAGIGWGVWIILLIALVSSLVLAVRPPRNKAGLQLWIRTRNHYQLYQPAAKAWNANHPPAESVNLHLLSDQAMQRRMLAGFLGSTHTADMIELERNLAGTCFAGPLENIGFVDLTDRLQAEGIYEQINRPSFSPWTSRGRIFGLPHDVHPVLLAYRSDLVAQAGIDMSAIATWDDFERIMKPLVKDLDGDGQPDRYPLNFWYTDIDMIEMLILQAGGAYFDGQGRPVIDQQINAEVLVRLARWVCGPDRIAVDAPEFIAAGNRMRLDGVVVCSFAPDWLVGVWRQDLPQLTGKVRLMPLPAWQTNGRHTSVWGGSMMGIAKTCPDFETAWNFTKQLYLSDDLARRLYQSTGIITPFKRLWSAEFYDEPVEFFGGQPVGRLYINVATSVPARTSSPYNILAKNCVRDALVALRRYAVQHDRYSRQNLLPEATRQLSLAHHRVKAELDRNVFLQEEQR